MLTQYLAAVTQSVGQVDIALNLSVIEVNEPVSLPAPDVEINTDVFYHQ